MLSKQAVYEIIDRVLSSCNYYTMVTIMSTEVGLTRFANSQIHQNVFNEDNTVTITVYSGKKKSEITTNLLDDISLKQVILKAEENLKFMPEGEFEIPELIDGEIASEESDERLDEYFSIKNRALLVKEGIELLTEGFTAAGALSLQKTAIAIGNNKGTRRYGRTHMVSFNLVVMHEGGTTGCVQMDTNNSLELDILESFKVAYQKAKLGINPESIEPGSYTVILEHLAVGELLNYINYIGFSGRNMQLGMSFLIDKLDTKVFGDNISIVDDVNNENTFPLYFDLEGNRRQRLNIIDKGIAREVAYDIKTALKDGTNTTGHAAGDGGFALNLVMEGGSDNLLNLIKGTKRGVLITKFHYMNIVNPRQAVLTALTRDGLFLIEDGQIKCGLKNMRFTESMLNAFNKVVGITSERRKVPGFLGVNYVPALKIEDFHFTGKTE